MKTILFLVFTSVILSSNLINSSEFYYLKNVDDSLDELYNIRTEEIDCSKFVKSMSSEIYFIWRTTRNTQRNYLDDLDFFLDLLEWTVGQIFFHQYKNQLTSAEAFEEYLFEIKSNFNFSEHIQYMDPNSFGSINSTFEELVKEYPSVLEKSIRINNHSKVDPRYIKEYYSLVKKSGENLAQIPLKNEIRPDSESKKNYPNLVLDNLETNSSIFEFEVEEICKDFKLMISRFKDQKIVRKIEEIEEALLEQKNDLNYQEYFELLTKYQFFQDSDNSDNSDFGIESNFKTELYKQLESGSEILINEAGLNKKPNLGKLVSATAFSSISSLGLSTSIAAGTSKGMQIAGGLMMAVGTFAQTINQIISLFTPNPVIRNYDQELWYNYKNYIDDERTGVIECLSYSPETKLVNLGYRNHFDSNNTIWVDTMNSTLVFNRIKKTETSNPKSRLLLGCFSGTLKIKKFDINSFGYLVSKKDQQTIWEIAVFQLLAYGDYFEFTCGSETGLIIRTEYYKSDFKKSFIPEKFSGEPKKFAYAEHDVCDKFPIKRIKFTLPSCSVDPHRIDFGYTSCSELYSLSEYNSEKRFRYTISDISNFDTQKTFIFKKTEFDWTFKPFEKIEDRLLCNNQNDQICSWPDYLISHKLPSIWIREFNVELGLNQKFEFVCPNKMLPYVEGSDELSLYSYTSEQIAIVEFNSPSEIKFKVGCRSIGRDSESDFFRIQYKQNNNELYKASVSKPNLNLNLRDNFGLYDTEKYGKELELKFSIDLGKENWDKLKNQKSTWFFIEFYFGYLLDNTHGSQTFANLTFANLFKGTWFDLPTSKTYQENFKTEINFILKAIDNRDSTTGECKGNILPFEEKVSVYCPPGIFRKPQLRNKVYFLKAVTSDAYCNSDNPLGTCTKDNLLTSGSIIKNPQLFHPGIDSMSYCSSSSINSEKFPDDSEFSCPLGILYHHTAFPAWDYQRYSNLKNNREDLLSRIQSGQYLVSGVNPETANFHLEQGNNFWCCEETDKSNNRKIGYDKKLIKVGLIEISDFIPSASYDSVNVSRELYLKLISINDQILDVFSEKSDLILLSEKYNNLGIQVQISAKDLIKDYYNQKEKQEKKIQEIIKDSWNLFLEINSDLAHRINNFICCYFDQTGELQMYSESDITKDSLGNQPSCDIFKTYNITDTFGSEIQKITYDYSGETYENDIELETELVVCFKNDRRITESKKEFQIIENLTRYLDLIRSRSRLFWLKDKIDFLESEEAEKELRILEDFKDYFDL